METEHPEENECMWGKMVEKQFLERGNCMLFLSQDGGRTEEQKDETQVETYVAQQYIENPYLIGGKMPIQASAFLVWGKITLTYGIPPGQRRHRRLFSVLNHMWLTSWSDLFLGLYVTK